MVGAPEIGPRIVLSLLDDRAADGAGAGKGIEQRIAIAAADRALQRAGRPEEIAAMALFLASDDASYVNGQAFPVDGGLSSTHPFAKPRK